MLTILRWWFDQLTLYGGGKGGGGSAPPPPDYRGAAEEQSAASQALTLGQTWANRPNLNTPWGQQVWSNTAAVDPATGQPVTQWTSNVNLTPEGQAALSAQQDITQGRSQAAQTLLGQATQAFQTPFDWENLPKAPTDVASEQQRTYGTMSSMLQPGRQQQQAALDNKLANMGVPLGSQAHQMASQELANQWTQEDKSMMAQALSEGRADIGTQQALRQAAISEQGQRRVMTLNELNALLTGQQVSMPQMPSFSQAGVAQAPQLLNAAQSQGQYGLQAAQQNLAAQQAGGADIGSLVGSVGGIAAMAMMLCSPISLATACISSSCPSSKRTRALSP